MFFGSGPLTEEQARTIFAQGEEAVVFALLELSKQLAEQQAKTAAESHQTPSTPSGMKPPYQKPPAQVAQEAAGRQAGPSRLATPDARADRLARRSIVPIVVRIAAVA